MNKQQKQVLEAQLKAEQQTLKKLQKVYKTALDDIDKNIAALMARTDVENLQSIIYQVQYQKALKSQINGILDTMQAEQFTTISEYLTGAYENAYVGTMYDLHKQGIPIITPINQKQVVKALTNNSKLSKPLYDSLGVSVTKLKHNIQRNLSAGIASGKSYAEIADAIGRDMLGNPQRASGGAYYLASRIARTEGHRVQNQAVLDAQHEAKDKGADIVKQWDATLDDRTRPDHAEADGQIREIDDDFIVGGVKMQAPGIGGSAEQVINCRCACLQRAKWALDEDELKTLQERANYFGLDKTKDFEDFKDKYLVASEETQEDEQRDIIDKLDRLKNSGMSESDYNDYLSRINNHENPDIRNLYKNHADEINNVKYVRDGGVYRPSTNSLEFDYPNQSYIDNGMDKFSTLAHEYGHFFDAKVDYDLTFNEMETLRNNIDYGLGDKFFKNKASSSDEFLAAVRKDKDFLQRMFDDLGFANVGSTLRREDASAGVQDAIDGLFPNSRIGWGHGEKYYNRKYNSIKDFIDPKKLKEVYKNLGLPAKNKSQVMEICRQYEAASEMWANITSAEVCGGKELEFTKKYLPNSYEALKKIVKGAK